MDMLAPGADAPIRVALLHDSGARTLAQALISWSTRNAKAGVVVAPADAVQADGDAAVAAARSLAGDACLGLFLGSEGCNDTALRINRLWQSQEHPGLFLLRSARGHELLSCRHPGQSPCLHCWHTQLQNFPWLHEGPAEACIDADMLGAALAGWLRAEPLQADWHCLRLSPGRTQRLRALRDPVCPHCSAWSRRPTQAFYVQPTEAA